MHHTCSLIYTLVNITFWVPETRSAPQDTSSLNGNYSTIAPSNQWLHLLHMHDIEICGSLCRQIWTSGTLRQWKIRQYHPTHLPWTQILVDFHTCPLWQLNHHMYREWNCQKTMFMRYGNMLFLDLIPSFTIFLDVIWNPRQEKHADYKRINSDSRHHKHAWTFYLQ